MTLLGAWYEDPAQGALPVLIVDIDHVQNTAACLHEDGSLFVIPLRDLHVIRMDDGHGVGTSSLLDATKMFLEDLQERDFVLQ